MGVGPPTSPTVLGVPTLGCLAGLSGATSCFLFLSWRLFESWGNISSSREVSEDVILILAADVVAGFSTGVGVGAEEMDGGGCDGTLTVSFSISDGLLVGREETEGEVAGGDFNP